MTSKWNYCPLTSDEQQVESDLAKSYAGVPPVSELLVQRGISSVREAEKFFHPSLKDLHDPFLMPDMDKAVHRLNRAMGAKEQIMVYGDYDVDGTTAVALVYKYLRNFYSHIDYYIPTRNEDGYGISKATIDMAARQGVKLFIILDCGIKATEEIEYARSLGIDFIICDHHVPDEKLPPALPSSTRNWMGAPIHVPTSQAAAWAISSCRLSPYQTDWATPNWKGFSTSWLCQSPQTSYRW